ncbi:MAG TPA: alpha/beta fold hydrolase [Jatrophihabitans sp.]|nr:alpha/beta fold hydrolase [Jatrophihabitans sp.]
MEPTCLATAGDGVRLAVYDTGPADGPTVLAVHGYPDNAALWDAVARRLAGRCRFIRYDVRGTGRSDPAAGRPGYRLDQLADDARAVLAATVGERDRVHLLGHDWGSVQGWHFLTAGALAGRFASFTSISGPSIAYVQPWLIGQLRGGDRRAALRQLAHSAYIALFKLPVLPELAWRSGVVDRLLGDAAATHRGPREKLNGLELYRANLLTRHGPRPVPVETPVQVLAPTRDPYISPELQLGAPRPYVRQLVGRTVSAGHWLPLTHPGLVADSVTRFAERVETGAVWAGDDGAELG